MEMVEAAPAEVRGLASPFVSKIMAPGDIALDLKNVSKVLRLGSGLRQDGDSIMATKAGRLRFQKQTNKYWVEGSQKRYIPNVEDVVIGIMVDRRFESFLIDIGGPAFAILPSLAFEGATRRNIPNLQAGKDFGCVHSSSEDLLIEKANKWRRAFSMKIHYVPGRNTPGAALYARVVNAHRDSDPELSCTDSTNKAAGFGPLKGGYIFDCTTGLARGLLSKPTCPVLEALGKSLSYEIAVGMNGRVWVNAAKPATTIIVSNAILNAEFLTPVQQHIMVKKLIEETMQ